jgi:hypothetical protein
LLDTKNAGHIYVYRVFNLPYEIRVQPATEDNGARKVEIDDPGLLKRYYNPAQLALIACAQIEAAGPEGIPKLTKVVSDLAFNDYYVVAGAATDPGALQRLETMILGAINGKKPRWEHRELLDLVEGQKGEVPGAMERGSRMCGIENAATTFTRPSSFDQKSSALKKIVTCYLAAG